MAQRATHAGGSRQLTPESSFKELVEVWLADLDLEGGLAPSTRALYERNMRQLVMPAFEHYTLREVTIGRRNAGLHPPDAPGDRLSALCRRRRRFDADRRLPPLWADLAEDLL